MKKYFFYFLVIFISCEQKKEEDTSTLLPSKETELKSLLNKYPDSMILKEDLIQYYRENGNYPQALRETNDAIKTNNNNPRFYDILATLQFEDGDTTNAIKSFEKAISFYPAPEYLISLGTLYAHTKNSNAISVADLLVKEEKKKKEKEAYFIKGLYYNNINEKEKAITFFDKALMLNYTFMEAYREKAIALYDMEKYKEALVVVDKAVTLQNNFEEGYYYKGKILEKLNRKDEAIESYERALLYDHEYSEAKDALMRLGVKKPVY